MKQTNKHMLPILVALVVSIAPQILRLPLWIVVWCAVLWGYVILTTSSKLPRPNPFFLSMLTIVGLLGILQTYKYVLSGPAFIGILSVMAGLKPLEINDHRGRMVTIFLAYFLIITSLFEYENLAITIYMFFSVLVNTAALIHINRSQEELRNNFFLSARILTQALPLMIVLFFLFPRLPGSFFRLTRQPIGQTGFTEKLSLGDVAKLVISDKVAFRAEFKNSIPEPNLLYWRGIVFREFNGNSWSTGFRAPTRRAPLHGSNPVEYNITLEPHQKKWIFSLDLPVLAPYPAYMLDDYTMLLKRNIKKKLRYKVKSYTSFNTGRLKNWERVSLKLPEKGNEKARILGRKWAEGADSPEEIVETALTFFRESNFIYTIKPNILRNNPIDDFLFNTQKGFCEHYASAFAFLMRAAGIPSRIVGGYVGGKVNPFGNYLIVRQSDAHVWAEVWIAEKGWIRVDPTSIVVPARVAQGITGALSAEELPAFLVSRQRGAFLDLWEKIGLGWDALSTKWDMVFTGYSYWEQKVILSHLGINFSH
ncbi:MAG: DUF3488 domain-containing transglutaminase family protein, partial [Desulfobacterales bacterium]